MGLFYAYAKDPKTYTYRFLMVFASRDVADEWWRFISTLKPNDPNERFSRSIKRINPYLYTHDSVIGNIYDIATNPAIFPEYNSKMLLNLLPNSNASVDISPILPEDVTDNVSGDAFFIRSKLRPNEFWYCPPDNTDPCKACQQRSCTKVHRKVLSSTTKRTKFLVGIAKSNSNLQLDTGIMINSDDVHIIVDGSSVSISDDRTLVVGWRIERLRFSDLKGRFGACGPVETDGVTIIEKDGEDWELVI